MSANLACSVARRLGSDNNTLLAVAEEKDKKPPSTRADGKIDTSAFERGELRIEKLSLLYDPPVENCELKPYVLLR